MSSRTSWPVLCSLGLLLVAFPLAAQHAGHGVNGQRDTTGIVARTETQPPDDSVLAQAPNQLRLAFPSHVRLVKLTLRDERRSWVDINFRYNPRPDDQYSLTLPGLQEASYYTADWAVLLADEQLVRGSFSFAFGPDAEPPSVIREAEENLLQQRYGDPAIRYVAPPPTQIIINQDPPQYDPPFTIQLEDGEPDR